MTPTIRHIGIVSAHYPPYPHVAAQRAFRFSQELGRRGFEVTVFTGSFGETASVITDDGTRVLSTGGAGWLPSIPPRLPSLLRKARTGVRSFRGGAHSSWMKQAATQACWQNLPACERPDVLWAIHGSNTAHALANWLGATWSVPWVADFKDPWRTSNPLNSNVATVATARRIRSASAITTASVCEGRSVFADFGMPSTCIYTPSAAVERLEPRSSSRDGVSNRLELVFTGHVGRGRMRPDLLIEGLKPLFRDGIARLNYFGHNVHDLVLGNDDLLRFGWVVDRGWVEPATARNACADADALVHLSVTVDPTLCVKLLDYIVTDRPILVVPADPEPLLDSFSEANGIFVAKTAADVEATARNLYKVKQIRGNTGPFVRSTEHLSALSQGQTLVDVLATATSSFGHPLLSRRT